jgi:hypothetical protein
MAAGETPTLLSARRKECGRLDRGHSGVLARVLSGGGRNSSTFFFARVTGRVFCRANSLAGKVAQRTTGDQ